ncbi:MAG: hypothetical protein FWF94_08040 [Oscillospiraceae bacterium]|nr:hypothetical protein [Oscillospiraceae bacterium]
MDKPISFVPWTKSLKARLTFTSILTSLLIGTVMMIFLTNIYQNRIESEYKNKITSLSSLSVSMLSGEDVDRYILTLEKDAEYEQVLKQLRIYQREFNIAYIVISRIDEKHELFVFDTDEDENSRMDLGESVLINDTVKDILLLYQKGEKISPYTNTTEWGRLLITGEPILREDSSVSAYVFVSVFMDDVLQERAKTFAFLGLLIIIIVAVSILVNMYIIRKYAETKREAEELAAKTDFYHQMAHDILTPLTRVSTCVQSANQFPEDAPELLIKAQADIMGMAKTINDTLIKGKAGDTKK